MAQQKMEEWGEILMAKLKQTASSLPKNLGVINRNGDVTQW